MCMYLSAKINSSTVVSGRLVGHIMDWHPPLPTPVLWLLKIFSAHMWAAGSTWAQEWEKCSQLQFISIVSDSLQPHVLKHAKLPCSSLAPGVYSNSRPLSQWCHPTISSSVVPFSSYLQSIPASGSFPMSQFFTSDDKSIGVSGSASVLSMNIQDWFPLDGLVGSPCSPRDSQESSPTPQLKSINSSALSFL